MTCDCKFQASDNWFQNQSLSNLHHRQLQAFIFSVLPPPRPKQVLLTVQPGRAQLSKTVDLFTRVFFLEIFVSTCACVYVCDSVFESQNHRGTNGLIRVGLSTTTTLHWDGPPQPGLNSGSNNLGISPWGGKTTTTQEPRPRFEPRFKPRFDPGLNPCKTPGYNSGLNLRSKPEFECSSLVSKRELQLGFNSGSNLFHALATTQVRTWVPNLGFNVRTWFLNLATQVRTGIPNLG